MVNLRTTPKMNSAVMYKTPVRKTKVKSRGAYKSTASEPGDILSHLAFDNTAQANIISTVSTGQIIMANRAACKLLGYSKKELLTKNRADIFDINESSFKKMLKQLSAEGQSAALITAIKKDVKLLPCEITSAIFMDEGGVEKAITTITDISQSILKQKEIDAGKEKIVAENIEQVKAEQKELDIEKDKVVADDIAFAKSEQKELDIKKDKVVAKNIVLAKSKQKGIDAKKDKIVASNIMLAQKKSDARLADNNEWVKYIAKASYDVMWDWNIITGQVYIGDSIEEVFGYKLRNNSIDFKDLTKGFIAEEEILVKKNLMKVLDSDSKSWNDSYNMKRFDGSVASVTSRASIVRDEDGNAIRLIGATQDVSRLQDLEKKLDEQIIIHEEDSEKFLLAAKLSFDVIWDWNLATNEVFLGDGFEELFGYRIKNNKGDMIADWANYLHPDDKDVVITSILNAIKSPATKWELAYRVSRVDGSIAKVYVRASIFRDHGGKAYRMIGAMQDLSRQSELEEKLEKEIASKGQLLTEYNESFKLIFNSSTDILYDIDLVTNEIVLSDAYEKEFGYKIVANMSPVIDWVNHIHNDDREAVIKDYMRMLGTEETDWKYTYRFLKSDNSVITVLSSAIVLRTIEGKAYRIIGSLQDISKQKVLEEKLEQEIRLKEKQIADATYDAKQTERSEIGKELHDNVNQLLGVSRLYLEMAKKGGEDSEMYLSRSSEYTLTAIEEIRKLTKGLTTDTIKNLGLCETIENIASDTMQVNQVKIFSDLNSFIEESVNDKFKLNVFRIVQEQLNNILKHAKATEVRISLVQTKNSIALSISDNGVGFDTSQKQKGIGLANIKSRASSFNGVADFVSQLGKGCVLTVLFPASDFLLNRV